MAVDLCLYMLFRTSHSQQVLWEQDDRSTFGPLSSLLFQHLLQARFNSADLNIAYKMDVAEYQKLCPYAEALEENWGKPPGETPPIQTVSSSRLDATEKPVSCTPKRGINPATGDPTC